MINEKSGISPKDQIQPFLCSEVFLYIRIMEFVEGNFYISGLKYPILHEIVHLLILLCNFL